MNGLKQIVDSRSLKGLKRIAVIGCGEDDGAGDIAPFQQVESITISQVDIHKYHIGRRVVSQPFAPLAHRVHMLHDLCAWQHFCNELVEALKSRRFIFEYYDLHKSGRLTT